MGRVACLISTSCDYNLGGADLGFSREAIINNFLKNLMTVYW